MFGFGKKKREEYDIINLSNGSILVHLTDAQSEAFASKGFKGVTEITLDKGETCWMCNFTYTNTKGEYEEVDSLGIGFLDETPEKVIHNMIN